MSNELTKLKTSDTELADKIHRLEDFIIENCDPCKIKWVHRFAPGMYSREMIVEEDTLVTGAIHKTEHLSVFLEGAMLIPGEDGESVMIEAPIVEICQPGVKRVGIALDRCRWITFHPTNETDIEVCEEKFFTNNIEDVPNLLEPPKGFVVEQEDFGLAQRTVGRDGWLPPNMVEQLEQIPVHDSDEEGIEVLESSIHGKGVFTTVPRKAGEQIGVGVDDGKLMSLSRYMNHSSTPNVVHEVKNNSVLFFAKGDIEPQTELTIDYEETAG